jgi:sulfopyruvate decarboxylase TPP-binding subunit
MVESPSTRAVLEQLKMAEVRFLAGLPDAAAASIIEAAEQDASFRVIRIHREDEGISICCALSYGQKRAAVAMDCSGFLGSVGSVAAVGTELHRPLVMLVGQLDTGERPKTAGSDGESIAVVRSLLDEMDIPHLLVERSGEEASIAGLIDHAYSTPRPLAILFGAGVVLP